MKNAYRTKCTPKSYHTLQPTGQVYYPPKSYRALTRQPLKVSFQLTQPPGTPRGGGLKSKNQKNICLLKFNFKRGTFYKELPNSQQIAPSGSPTHINQKLGPSHKIKNLLCHSCLAQQQLSKMVWHNPIAPMTMGLLHFREKDRVQGRAYQGDWAGVLPTQKLLQANLASPENLFTHSKVFHDFL